MRILPLVWILVWARAGPAAAAALALPPGVPIVEQAGPARIQPPSPPATAQWSSAATCNLLAGRGVINELMDRCGYLQQEFRRLDEELSFLWARWGGEVGILGFSGEWLRPSLRMDAPTHPRRAQKLQTDLFHVYSRLGELDSQLSDLDARLREADMGWWKAWEWYLRSLERREPAERRFRRISAGMQSDLNELALKNNDLDKKIRLLEDDFDNVFPEVEWYLRDTAQDAIRLDRPSHWDYMRPGGLRPSLQYDAQRRFKEHLERISQEQATEPGTKRP